MAEGSRFNRLIDCMSGSGNQLTVFPSALSLRRFQQDEALKSGCLDSSAYIHFTRLKEQVLLYADSDRRALSPTARLLLRGKAVTEARAHLVEEGPLTALSDRALGDLIDLLDREFSLLPKDVEVILDWLLHRPRNHKLYQLGLLYTAWRKTLKQAGYRDDADSHAAVLKVLEEGPDAWPPLLKQANALLFRSVLWLNPFEEACVYEISRHIPVAVRSMLPPAHAEAAADRLGQLVHAEEMDEAWTGWAEDLADALETAVPGLIGEEQAAHVEFSRSAGTYGEIEDLCRRICWNLEHHETPPHRIALVVPDISAVQDIIPHVCSRFGIPYYFRKGRPVLSSACVKAFMAWLAFPLKPERDGLIDLIRNPALRFDDREASVTLLSRQAPRIEAASLPPGMLRTHVTRRSYTGQQAQALLEERVVEPEDHFNQQALKAVADALQALGNESLSLRELMALLEELLQNSTVRPLESHEQGVWIVKPEDTAGLDFDQVFVAGLNEGVFPAVPNQDALLSDAERLALRSYLTEKGSRIGAAALPLSETYRIQDHMKFLSTLGMAREKLTLSCQAVDEGGNEMTPSMYYSKLWSLAGWSAQSEMICSEYDAWRMSRFPSDLPQGIRNIFEEHYSAQQAMEAEERTPMPGESFLPIIPIPFCRAEDEALQSATFFRSPEPGESEGVEADARTQHVTKMLAMETERINYLDTAIDERSPSEFCGYIPEFKAQVQAWFEQKKAVSPTALERLAQCRYIFFLEQMLGMREERLLDDTPDPMDRGSLIHAILRELYTAMAEGRIPCGPVRKWAVRRDGTWMLSEKEEADALPLVALDPSARADCLSAAAEWIDRRLSEVVLGHRGIWEAERSKVAESILNLVRHDMDTCLEDRCFPALFEFKFSEETSVDLGEIQVRGKIDRIDLLFGEAGQLERIRVVDYKGPSRVRKGPEVYMDEIRRNLDCQLPIYAFAAQQFFLGEYNTRAANAITEAGYLFYQRDASTIARSFKNSLIRLDEPGLIEQFLQTLNDNLHRVKKGDFAVDPLIEGYADYQSICRVESVPADEL